MIGSFCLRLEDLPKFLDGLEKQLLLTKDVIARREIEILIESVKSYLLLIKE